MKMEKTDSLPPRTAATTDALPQTAAVPPDDVPAVTAASTYMLPPVTAATTGNTAASTDQMIAVRGVAKRLGTQEILRGVELNVGKCKTLVIIGRSGGGKSVLLKHLIGLLTPDTG